MPAVPRPHGQRNDTLYRAGLKLHSLAAGGPLDPHQVDTVLLDAARLCELPTREAHAVIASAQLHPRSVPADHLALQRGIELA